MVINGGMGTRINGRKSMGKWGYGEIISGVIPLLVIGVAYFAWKTCMICCFTFEYSSGWS